MNYILRNVPSGIWEKFNLRCIHENVSKREAIIKLMETYALNPELKLNIEQK